MLSFIELPHWTRWQFVVALFSAFGVINFFTFYDPLLNAPGTFQYALMAAVWILVPPVVITGLDFAFGRLFGIPVRWKFLWQLQIATLAISLPFFLLQFWFESSYSTYEWGLWVLLANLFLTFGCWVEAFWKKYQLVICEKRIVRFLMLCFIGFVMSTVASVSLLQPCLRAAQPWTSLERGRIRCFYTDVNPNAHARAKLMAQRIETMLGKVEETLQSQPVKGKINVFIFPDYNSLNVYQDISGYDDTHGESEYGIAGVAGLNGILLYDSDWEEMRSTVSHEMTHLVLGREIGDMRSVINEGTAVWVENVLSEGEPTIEIKKQQQISTASLASEDVFYTDDNARLFDSYYPHAGWLAQHTIESFGIEKWKEFARATSVSYLGSLLESDYDAESRFQKSYKRIYHFPVP